jgi:hypothetical protein
VGISTILLSTPQFITTSEINHKSSNWFKQHCDANYTEIIYVDEGSGEYIFEENRFIDQEGDLIIFNPFSPLEGKACKDDAFKGVSVSFSNLHINGNDKGWLTDPTDLPIIHLLEEKNEIHNYFQAILREYNLKHSGYQEVISSILQTVIIKITRLLKNTNHHSVSPVCLEVKKYIEAELKAHLHQAKTELVKKDIQKMKQRNWLSGVWETPLTLDRRWSSYTGRRLIGS